MVLEEFHHRQERRGRDIDSKLILPNRELLHKFRQAGHDILPILVQAFRLVLVLVRGVHNRRFQLSLSCRIFQLDNSKQKARHLFASACDWGTYGAVERASSSEHVLPSPPREVTSSRTSGCIGNAQSHSQSHCGLPVGPESVQQP